MDEDHEIKAPITGGSTAREHNDPFLNPRHIKISLEASEEHNTFGTSGADIRKTICTTCDEGS